MIRNISIGIDVGSQTTRVVVGEFLKGEKNPKIIGIGESPTLGMRHGYIVNPEETVTSIEEAVALATKTSNVKIKKAFVSISGLTLRSELGSGVAIISKADGEVTKLDIDKALNEAEDNINLNNKKVIHSYPISFKLDGKEVLGSPEGMRGNKLEIKALFITYSTLHLDNLIEAVALAGIETTEIIASPVAASNIVLSEKEQVVGVALADIGAEKVNLAIFENGIPTSVYTFSIGGVDITNDIALGLKIPLEKAESLKLGTLSEDGSEKKLDDIIEARLSDIFELIENHLKKIKRSELLPAGIVFIGGSANIAPLPEFSKTALKLPSRVGTTEMFGNMKTKLRGPEWFTALGLVYSNDSGSSYSSSSIHSILRGLKNAVKSSISQLLP